MCHTPRTAQVRNVHLRLLTTSPMSRLPVVASMRIPGSGTVYASKSPTTDRPPRLLTPASRLSGGRTSGAANPGFAQLRLRHQIQVTKTMLKAFIAQCHKQRIPQHRRTGIGLTDECGSVSHLYRRERTVSLGRRSFPSSAPKRVDSGPDIPGVVSGSGCNTCR